MKHLEYKDTNNKAFKTYYDKFKKMVKSDLDGDGWFLLVNDFPFKDGDNLMFTAGEDIGKWKDKNLVSLYGKTNYIIGRCRKKGPVLSLLHFQEGDYIKQATESGLRKQLKEYFQGTGVSTRIFKSVKITDAEPETEEDIEETNVPVEEQTLATGTIETIEVPEPKPASITDAIGKLVANAESLGVVKEQAFINLMGNFQKAVPRVPMMKMAIGKLNEYFQNLPSQPQSTPVGGGDSERLKKAITDAEKQIQDMEKEIKKADTETTRLEGVLEQQDKVRDTLLDEARKMVEQYNKIVNEDTEEARKLRFNLSKDSMEILKGKIPTQTQEIQKTEKEWEKAIDHLIDLTVKIEEIESGYKQNLSKLESVN